MIGLPYHILQANRQTQKEQEEGHVSIVGSQEEEVLLVLQHTEAPATTLLEKQRKKKKKKKNHLSSIVYMNDNELYMRLMRWRRPLFCTVSLTRPTDRPSDWRCDARRYLASRFLTDSPLSSGKNLSISLLYSTLLYRLLSCQCRHRSSSSNRGHDF